MRARMRTRTKDWHAEEGQDQDEAEDRDEESGGEIEQALDQ